MIQYSENGSGYPGFKPDTNFITDTLKPVLTPNDYRSDRDIW